MPAKPDPIVPITPDNPVPPNTDGRFQPRYLGPIGNRVAAIAGVRGDHLIYYAGAASGGIFKTADGGTTWKPVFDQPAAALPGQEPPEPVASIGALAVSESSPNQVWAGTGESWIRGPISIGNGVYKSVNGGETWTRMGLFRSGRIARIVIHPTNPDVVWVAAMGSCYADIGHQERGVYRTVDGGLTWERVHTVNENTGCSDLAVDANNPDTLYAGMWEFQLRSWTRVSGGPGSGLWKSYDGGDTWFPLTNGLPMGELDESGNPRVVGKISVCVARSDSDYVYASIETGDGEPTPGFPYPGNGQFWQSTDAGASWTLQSYNRNINSRAAYYTRNAVSTDNPNEVYTFAPHFGTSLDGGANFEFVGFPNAPGLDHHEGWIDPDNGDRMAVASDYGVALTENRGHTWRKISLPIAQIYSVSTDNRIPYNVFGNVQDKVATWGPSNARIPVNQAQSDLDAGFIPRGLWTFAGGGECGYTIPDPKDDRWLWSSGSSDGPNGGWITLIDRATGHWRTITVKPSETTGTPPIDIPYRFHWHLPLAVSVHDNPDNPQGPNRAFAGSQYLHVSDDRGQSWQLVDSPALTGNDAEFLQSSGGITADNINVRMAYTLSAIAESPLEAGLLWIGTSDQRVWLARRGDGPGYDWTELTANIPDLPFTDDAGKPPWGLVSWIAPSPHDASVAYVAFDFHQAADTRPFIYKATDYGATWQLLTPSGNGDGNGIPHSVVSYVHVVAEDPVQQGLLFAGTENALYVSLDDGGRWFVLPGLPPVPVTGIVIQENFCDLALSTFGRGFWIVDDITPLRQLATIEPAPYLFELSRPIYRFLNVASPFEGAPGSDPTVGQDPPSPAPINFYLDRPADTVKLTICSVATCAKVREINLPQRVVSGLPSHSGVSGVPGINRVWWDLLTDPTTQIALRTNPPQQIGTAYCPSGIRPYSDPVVGGALSYLVLPGDYTVELTVDGKSVGTRPLTVRRDPTSRPELTDAEIQAELEQQAALTGNVSAGHDVTPGNTGTINGAYNTVVADVNTIEFVCFQLEQLRGWVQDPKALKLIDKFEGRWREVEEPLIQRKLTGDGEDLARFPSGIADQLIYLGGIVANGDFVPTDQQAEQFFKNLKPQVDAAHKATGELVSEVPAFNDQLRSLRVSASVLATPPDLPPSAYCSLFGAVSAF